MKLNYTHILLFSLLLNILLLSSEVHNQRNHNSTTYHTPKIPTNRSLCECELYAPANYDNDQEMKVVMENFNKQTQQRLREYDERMKTTRQKCKEQCDKEIQKIILKDKIEKELTEKLGALKTDIRTEDIPTCFCEKSLAGKTEKVCLNCGKNMGGVASGWGLLSGIGYVAWTNYVTQKAMQKGIEKGIATVVSQLEDLADHFVSSRIDILGMITPETYRCPQALTTSIYGEIQKVCVGNIAKKPLICTRVGLNNDPFWYRPNVLRATTEGASAAKIAEATEVAKYTSTTSSLTTAITASVIAIVVIVSIMVIIYLILRYRRKKKIKKKLQYVKLLEE
ncbi:rifin PIR protein, putative [Plasmodium reichenowi]|uniref:Rifin PIR protein, putative n=1 Tax=Plasmodium reichenowi TaxID=5854 RepID=A0A2P9DMW7_PLARE|nr:rifin PIR protein, putative [Plasmodium reichenowi]